MRIYVWGTGSRLGCLINDSNLNIDDITGFIDNNYNKTELYNKKVLRPEQMLKEDYDLIIVASNYSLEISKQCDAIGLDKSKIYFAYKHYTLNDINVDSSLAECVLGIDFVAKSDDMSFCVENTVISNNLFFGKSQLKNDFWYQHDHVRISSLELVANEINKKDISGEVSEVGVFRGEFAQYINYAFPNKKCYLFDTFEGFDEQELSNKTNNTGMQDVWMQVFKDTCIEKVMSRMQYPENIVIKKGFFPDSLDGLEEKFAFVSLDVDLEDSMYECLKYFYPRLSKGGYIFVHDYNAHTWAGVRNAVDRYEKDSGISLAKVPIPDNAGTLIITK